jgi:hypothetical protein
MNGRGWLAGPALVGFVLCATAWVGRPVAAQEESGPDVAAELRFPLDVGASFFTRFETRRNYSPGGIDASDFVRMRARLLLTTAPLAVREGLDLQLRFAPQATGLWHVGGDTLDDPALGLHEGVLVLRGARLRGEIGRFEMVYGEHLVVGNVDWHETGRAFDGLRLRFAPRGDAGPWVDLFGAWLTEGFVEGPFGEPFGAGDQVFTGLYGALGPLLADGLALDLYALLRLWPTTDAIQRQGAAMPTFGVRVKNRSGLLDYRLEAGVQVGSRPAPVPTGETQAGDNPTVFAYQADLEVGINLAGDALRIALEGLVASGDDPETADEREDWDQLFPTAHRWLGYMDFVGPRTNVTSGVLHVAYRAQPWLFTVDGHAFWRPEPPPGQDSYFGTELDLGVLYALGNGLHVRGGYGLFLPAEDVAPDPLHFVELELRFDLR